MKDFGIGLLVIVLAPIWFPAAVIAAVLMAVRDLGKSVRTAPSRPRFKDYTTVIARTEDDVP